MSNRGEDQKARNDGLRLYFDVFKHLTTLSSGSIILLVSFLKQSKEPSEFGFLVSLAFLGFLTSSVSSIVVMLSTARTIRRNETTDQLPDLLGRAAYLGAVSGFAVGVISLGIFGCASL